MNCMHHNDEDFFETSSLKAIVYIDKDNSVSVKFTGFKDKQHSAIFSSWLMMMLNIDNSIFETDKSKYYH